LAVLSSLGFSDWKSRKNGSEWYGRCPIHDSKKNNTAFSFDQDGKFNCFSCGKHGKGAIDLFMAIRQVGFQEGVETLKNLNVLHELTKNAAKQEINQVQIPVTENPVFKSAYEKFAAPSDWLKNRGLTEDTLKRYDLRPRRDLGADRRVVREIRLVHARRAPTLGRRKKMTATATQAKTTGIVGGEWSAVKCAIIAPIMVHTMSAAP
jgi:DNA primase